MDSFGAFGELPFATLRDSDVGSTGIAPFYLSEAGHITEPTEQPANQFFEPRLTEAFGFSRSLATRDGFAGRTADGTGEIRGLNTDGFFDTPIARFSIDGRQVRVKRRALGGSYSAA
jgi:hypothetical protein